jgi:DinB superfamily
MRAPALTLDLERRFRMVWERTDRLFTLVGPDGIFQRPIALRHPFVFYVGHLPGFARNHVCRRLLGRLSFNPRFDEIFDRGIDPDVDDPTRCHAHPEVPDAWPALDAVLAYRDRVWPVPVGSYPAGASAWGVHELIGNGWEWNDSG